MTLSIVLRGAVVLLVDALVLVLLAWLLPGFRLDGAGAALVTAALVGVSTPSSGRCSRGLPCRSAC
jgi:hypothetical protein